MWLLPPSIRRRDPVRFTDPAPLRSVRLPFVRCADWKCVDRDRVNDQLAGRSSTMSDNRISTPFGAQSTAAEVVAGIDLGVKRSIITGGSSGLGLETAHALASANAEVTLAVRNLDAARRAAED